MRGGSMSQTWTFGKKLGGGFLVMVMFSVVLGSLAIYALREVVASKDRIITVNARSLTEAHRLNATTERKVAAARGFLLAREDRYLDRMRTARHEFVAILNALRSSS